MTPDKNFRMNKSSKCMLALMNGTAEARTSFKKGMIDAQLCEEAARRASLRSKDDKNKNPRGQSVSPSVPE